MGLCVLRLFSYRFLSHPIYSIGNVHDRRNTNIQNACKHIEAHVEARQMKPSRLCRSSSFASHRLAVFRGGKPSGTEPRNTASRWLANEEDRHSLDGFI